MKTQKFKLYVHSRTSANKNQEILVSSKDFPDIKVGDVLEIYHPDEEGSRLLLQVKQFEDNQHKDSISIEQSVASAFCLRTHKDVIVNKVEGEKVRLDLVELLFKEQYYGRSDMWRMCKFLTDSCVYVKKGIEFVDMRASVNELWAKGDNVTCGLVTEDTRIVFRSSTAVVQIFIQLSSEMWDFDLHGDLYFEKAVDGFLTDLFDRWKEQNCLHDVTIVLFSRIFYEAESIDQFPPSVRECLQMDCSNKIYEDFYQVIVQNERYEEWSSVLREIRTIFYEYQDIVLHYHEHGQRGWRIPRAYISTASQGNVLETLNMSLNLFERYYMDRNFDRTGKVSVVITPGPGVFEVDRQLANITKQRTIDYGVGSDLVCMGEQPLHAAPLFKFHSKSSHKSIEVGDDYNIPHWINHSFYMSKTQVDDHKHKTFVPRIKPPATLLKELEEGPKNVGKRFLHGNDSINDDNIPFVDYDEYDAQVFKLPSGTVPRSYSVRHAAGHGASLRHPAHALPKTILEAKARRVPRIHHPISDDFTSYMHEHKEKSGKDLSAAISIPARSVAEDISTSLGHCSTIHERNLSRESVDSSESDELVLTRPVVGSAGSPVGHSRNMNNFQAHRALINPFAPSRLQFKMTSNRRRWVHAFPVDQSGRAMQARHVHSVPHENPENRPWGSKDGPKGPMGYIETTTSKRGFRLMHQDSDSMDQQSQAFSETLGESPVSRFEPSMSGTPLKGSMSPGISHALPPKPPAPHVFKYGKTRMFGSVRSDQAWSPDMSTGHLVDVAWRPISQEGIEGRVQWKPRLDNHFYKTAVDWKSLTIPASLPVTTDYIPDDLSLKNDFWFNDYEVLPGGGNTEVLASFSRSSSHQDKNLPVYRRNTMTAHEVFQELISQRLGLGFQLITQKKSSRSVEQNKSTLKKRVLLAKEPEQYNLSIGRIFHNLSLNSQMAIRVRGYMPKHQQPQLHYDYRYRFQAPDSHSYDVSWTHFSNEKSDLYNLNHVDQYICTQGDWEYGLVESMKYWRARFLLLPLNNPATKKIIEKDTDRCDIYEEKSLAELMNLTMGFLKFLEIMNKIKRTSGQTSHKVKAELVTKAMDSNGGDSSPRQSEPHGADDKLTTASPLTRIIEAMVDPDQGLHLISSQPGLPMNTFISADAVSWCFHNVQDVCTITQASCLMQRLIDENMVLHASGNARHYFIYGFYLYYIPQRLLLKPGQSLDSLPHPTSHMTTSWSEHNCLFQNEWCEVSVLPVSGLDKAPESSPESSKEKEAKEVSPPRPKFYIPHDNARKNSDAMLLPEFEDWRKLTSFNDSGPISHTGGVRCLNERYKATLLHKFVNVEVDPNKKSDRKEFAMARYQAYFSPKCAFELQVQWMVATGCVLGELINNYARRATPCGFHFMPIPGDPFALPYTENSDPLRGPIFVPLNMKAFSEDIFEGCNEEKRQEMLYGIQDSIIKRFGFMPISVKVPDNLTNVGETYNHQYVHCTAGMFVLVPESTPGSQTKATSINHRGSMTSASSPKVSMTSDPAPPRSSSTELHKLYISRHGRPEAIPNEVGFLWSWNYMSSRRWRSANTGDESFQDTVLADFRKFCSNQDGRLGEFWDSYRGKVE